MKNINRLFFFLILLLTSFFHFEAYAQTYFGFKAGVNASKAYFDNEVYEKYYSTKVKPGFTAGAIFLIENKKKYGLYAEFLYSQKGKIVESTANDYETNTATYQYLDFPVLFRLKFDQAKIGWYLQLGPQVSYWLSGKGSFEVYQEDRDITVNYDYTINFDEPKRSSEYMNVTDANRTQIGLAVGGGVIWDMKSANYLLLDMRFTFGHTYMGQGPFGGQPGVCYGSVQKNTLRIFIV